MGNQNINIIGNISIILSLTFGNTVAHKQRHAIELHTVYLNAGVAEIMHIFIQSVDIGTIKAIVMVAADEYFMLVWQIAEPVEKIDSLILRPGHAEVTGMHNHIRFG